MKCSGISPSRLNQSHFPGHGMCGNVAPALNRSGGEDIQSTSYRGVMQVPVSRSAIFAYLMTAQASHDLQRSSIWKQEFCIPNGGIATTVCGSYHMSHMSLQHARLFGSLSSHKCIILTTNLLQQCPRVMSSFQVMRAASVSVLGVFQVLSNFVFFVAIMPFERKNSKRAAVGTSCTVSGS